MRTAFIAASFLAVVLYGIVLASWGHDWDYSQPLTFMIGFPTGKDFINLYAGGQIVSQSMDIKLLFSIEPYAKYLTELFNTNVHNYHYVWSYPPTMLLPARLFAGLPYLPAFALWSSATLAIFLGGLYLAGLRGWWLLAALLAPATAVNLFFGQYGYLLAGLLIGGLSLRDSRPILAGILLGLATIKPQLGLLLPILLLAQRQWWVIAAASATALLLLGLSLAVDGIEVWRHFIDFTLPLQRMFLEDGRAFFSSQYGDRKLFAGGSAHEGKMELEPAGYFFSACASDEVAGLQTLSLGGRIRGYPGDLRPGLQHVDFESEQEAIEVLGVDEPGESITNVVDRYGEIQVLAVVMLRGDHADDLPERVDERTAGASSADGRGGLYHRGEIRCAGRGGALQAADDTGRDRMGQPVGVSDDERRFSKDQVVASAKRKEGERLAGFYFENSNVLRRKARQDLEDILASIGEEGEALWAVLVVRHGHDDMVIGQDVTRWMDHGAAAGGEINQAPWSARLKVAQGNDRRHDALDELDRRVVAFRGQGSRFFLLFVCGHRTGETGQQKNGGGQKDGSSSRIGNGSGCVISAGHSTDLRSAKLSCRARL